MTSYLQNARQQTLDQKNYTLELLESMAKSLDLTPTQLEKIEQAYRGVSKHLATSNDPLLQNAEIYPQGSIRLKTAVKPIGQDEFDLDFILFLPNATHASREVIMAAVRARLNESGIYKDKLSELPRGFRINYAGEYHLDITPAKFHEHIWLMGQPLWVPDKREGFKESNAKGMAEWFDETCLLSPKRVALDHIRASNESMSSIEDLPEQHIKALLNLIIQTLKRHRDEWAQLTTNNFSGYKPISVLITTLATHAYKNVATSIKTYDNDYDLILDVVEAMPNYINAIGDEIHVTNPAMEQENYAEKWNRTKDSEGLLLRHAFNQWQIAAMKTFETLALQSGKGTDAVFNTLQESFGEAPVNHARKHMMEKFNNQRDSNNLSVSLKTGTVASATVASTTAAASVRKNTFYGAKP